LGTESSFSAGLQELFNGTLTVSVKAAMGNHTINWGRLARCYQSMPGYAEAVDVGPGLAAYQSPERSVAEEISTFALKEHLSVEQVCEMPWDVVRGHAEKAFLSLGAKLWLQSACLAKAGAGALDAEGSDMLERRLDAHAACFDGGVGAGPQAGRTARGPLGETDQTRAYRPSAGRPPASPDVEMARLEYLTRSSVGTVLKCGREMVHARADWPYAGTAVQDRLAKGYFANVYRGDARGVDYARNWLRAHGCLECKLAAQMITMLAIVDDGLLYDGFNVCDSAAFEIIARRCYGIERAYGECTKPEHWKSADHTVRRTQMRLLSKFDVVENMHGGYRDAAAEARVQKELSHEAQMSKHLKGAATGGSSSGAL